MKWQKRLNIALTIALTIAFILLGAFVFRVAYCRTFEALIDLYGNILQLNLQKSPCKKVFAGSLLFKLNAGFGVKRQIGKFALGIPYVPFGAYHRGVVGAENLFGQNEFQPVFLTSLGYFIS